MKRLGERIKRKRESLGLQLNELAKKVGISSSALSQIEKAKAMPSISHLKSIATNLYTTVGELIGENEALTTSPLIEFDSVTLLKENESGCSVYLLSDHGPNKQMDTHLLKLKPNANTNEITITHPGQTFLFVLQGKIQIEMDEKCYTLKEKDSFYFNANLPHIIYNKSDFESQIILVSTPPVG